MIYNAAVQLLFPPRRRLFLRITHQGSQMQDESAQLALQELTLWALNKMAKVDQLVAEVAGEVSLAWALWSSERNTCHEQFFEGLREVLVLPSGSSVLTAGPYEEVCQHSKHAITAADKATAVP